MEKNPALALEYVKAAAESGFAPAQTFLGCAYAEGKIVPRDMNAAVRWRELGAKNGTPADKWSLGNAFLYGYLVPKDQIKAVYWITQSANEGHAESILKLVEIYKNLERPEDEKMWARKYAQLEIAAAQKGNVDAMTSVASQYMSGKGGWSATGRRRSTGTKRPQTSAAGKRRKKSRRCTPRQVPAEKSREGAILFRKARGGG